MTNEQQEREVLNTLATLPERSRATILGVRVERLIHGYQVEGHEGTFLAPGAAKLIVQAHARRSARTYDVRASIHELHGEGSGGAYDLLLDGVTGTEVAEALRDVLTSDWRLTSSPGPFRLAIEIGPAGTGDDLLTGQGPRWIVEWLDDSGDEDLVQGKRTDEAHYFIGSRLAGARVYGEAVRGHWGIENGLHWQLDLTFGEDANRVQRRHGAANLALRRRLALSLLKRQSDKASIACKRLSAALDTDFLEEILLAGRKVGIE
jgi:predicted transposase YbfD/YdcC